MANKIYITDILVLGVWSITIMGINYLKKIEVKSNN